MLDFGLKHTARELATMCLYFRVAHYLPMKPRPGSPYWLSSHAEKYRGRWCMRLVWNETELKDAYQTVWHRSILKMRVCI